ncbi:UspA domain protein [Natronomonas moolapensis 8.8.11]|uniref:UspA domain protein n=1 Tax=Natronomonas moolapensis (strain DSM 18674 / CECT 7526 / JCM 14361 / 8.8.11) TaxID=268739 RepID=M1XKV4_NATM8|nr:universal stress protein [Natronomonas moolapensis]CCQ36573.1 UspA domain protein [Natronomonas moolapensis 8.8.11]
MAIETLLAAIGPNDGSRTDELIDAVVDIVEPTDASVVLLHVFSETAYRAGIEEAGFDPDAPPSPGELASRLAGVDAVAAALGDSGLEYDIVGEIGDEKETILRVAGDTDADLLCVSGRKRSPTGKAVFGSTVHELMMDAPCPVLFVREGLSGDAGTAD